MDRKVKIGLSHHYINVSTSLGHRRKMNIFIGHKTKERIASEENITKNLT